MCGRDPDTLEKILLNICCCTPHCVTVTTTLITILFHNLDWFTDLTYLLTVPIYTTEMKFWLIVSILIPPLFMLNNFFIDLFKRHYSLRKSLRNFLTAITGTTSLYFFYFDFNHQRKSKEMQNKYILKNRTASYKGLFGLFYLLEDGPQFLIQTINSLLIGKSQSWLMILSPILSMHGLLSKLMTEYKPSYKYTRFNLE